MEWLIVFSVGAIVALSAAIIWDWIGPGNWWDS
jgi:hypothetical protein